VRDMFQLFAASTPGERDSRPSWSGTLSAADQKDYAVQVFSQTNLVGKPENFKSTRKFTCTIGEKIWIWGGSHSFPPVKSSDLFSLDVATQEWKHITNYTGVPPSPRSDHCGAAVGKNFFIFGGSDENVKPLADVHKFNTATLEWSKLEPQGEGPTARSGHTCTPLGSKIYVFGGAKWDSTESKWKDKSNDLFIYNTTTNTWIKPTVSGEVPLVSTFASSFTLGNHIWILGGGRKDGDFVSDTMYALDTITLTWKNMKISGSFLAKDCISATVSGDKVFLFGGYRGEPVNELQCIDMSWVTKVKGIVSAS